MSSNNPGPNGPNDEPKKIPKPRKLAGTRVGRDEMNLAEYAFASFRNEVEKTSVVSERKWMVPDPNYPDREIEASWRVAGDPELGRPTATDVKVYLVLMEMTREANWSQEISFSTLNLLQRLNWSPNSKHYAMIRASFARLKAVNITARNCFWDNRGRLLKGQTGFSIIDNYHIDETVGRKGNQPQLSLSWWKWNDVLHQSMLVNYVKPIDLGFALSLNRNISVGLYRYLDKKRGGKRLKPAFTIGIRKLCEQHLQLADTKHISTMKRTLAPAHEELVSRGFLVAVEYAPLRDGSGERVIYRFSKAPTKPAPPKKTGDEESEDEKQARLEAEDAARERLISATFAFLQSDDAEDYTRIYDDAVSDLGEMDVELLNRKPDSPAVARTIRENMWAIIELEYPWMVTEVAARLEREDEGEPALRGVEAAVGEESEENASAGETPSEVQDES